MILYRADRKGRKTKPEAFATDGLTTKQINSGDDPEPDKKYGWLKTITSHIHKSDPMSKFIYENTAFLSFTTALDCRDRFLAGTDKKDFVPSSRASADAYVFQAEIDLSSCERVTKGVYEFSFNCNYSKLATDPTFQVSQMLLVGVKCNLHYDNPGDHKIWLIDAASVLKDVQHIYPVEFGKASNDREWLILPRDPMHEGERGFQARIPVADFWKVNFYSLR